MLLITLMITTVLPTPAPPKAPSCRLEKRADEIDDLDPVARVGTGRWSTSAGRRWIAYRSRP